MPLTIDWWPNANNRSRGERPHVVGRRQRGIDQRLDAVLLAQLGEPFEIDHAQMRIRRRFADQQLRAAA